MKTVEIEIFNHRFAVREQDNAPYLQQLAAEVDACIHALCTSSERISPLRAAIMAAYLFADAAKQQGEKEQEKSKSA